MLGYYISSKESPITKDILYNVGIALEFGTPLEVIFYED
jgi:hypothetical protein